MALHNIDIEARLRRMADRRIEEAMERETERKKFKTRRDSK